ncbi:MAG: hypothetical protein KME42_14890 [Tildeniella nuda ZEHNDER 1965/U140]|nr:hypothetical protein [Tildeniella nuda ZEHNDER 1965/U140]
MAKALLEQRWDITIVVAAIERFWAIAPLKPRDATPNASLMTAPIPLHPS